MLKKEKEHDRVGHVWVRQNWERHIWVRPVWEIHFWVEQVLLMPVSGKQVWIRHVWDR
jgi:hypothetical protein